MRMCFMLVLLGFCALAHANSTLRVGSHVLTAGDSTAQVSALLGKPSHKSHASSRARGARRSRGRSAAVSDGGDKWQYRDGNRSITVTFVNGKATDFDERQL